MNNTPLLCKKIVFTTNVYYIITYYIIFLYIHSRITKYNHITLKLE